LPGIPGEFDGLGEDVGLVDGVAVGVGVGVGVGARVGVAVGVGVGVGVAVGVGAAVGAAVGGAGSVGVAGTLVTGTTVAGTTATAVAGGTDAPPGAPVGVVVAFVQPVTKTTASVRPIQPRFRFIHPTKKSASGTSRPDKPHRY